MSRNGFTVIDTDAHYLDNLTALADYMDEPWRHRVKNTIPERLLPHDVGDRLLAGRIKREDVPYHELGSMTPDQIPGIMERLGIDAAIMVTNILLTLGHLTVRDMAVAFSNAYIDFMLDKVVDPARGIYTMPIVPWQEPEAGAAIIDRVAGHPGVVGVCFASSGANPPLGDVRYDPIYEAAQRHNLPVVYHSTAFTLIKGADYVDGFQRLIESHSLGFAVSNMAQLTSVVFSGLPERFPKLKFVFQESGLFWIPMMMYRMDEYFLKRREEAPLLRMLPSEYILDRFYFGTQPIEVPKEIKHLAHLFDMTRGTERFMYASDYPHFDYDDPSSILRLSFLDKQAKANVLAGNAASVFNFRKAGIQPWERAE